MDQQLILRALTSLLIVISLPPLFFLIAEVLENMKTKRDAVQIPLLVIYFTFMISGIVTLYINIQFQFFNAQTKDYTSLALMRNIIKHIGIAFVSWYLYFITREGGGGK